MRNPTHVALAIGGLGAAVLIAILLLRRPRAAFAVWLGVVCFVPEWFQPPLPIGIQPGVLLGLFLIPALLSRRGQGFVATDIVVLGFFVLVIGAKVQGSTGKATMLQLLATWGTAYVFGRFLARGVRPPDMSRVMLPIFSVVSVLALIEVAAHWNPFVGLSFPSADYAVWSPIQMRGGVPRAEGAFGHSIALGASLGLSVPFILNGPFRPLVRVVGLLLVCLAAAATLSRTGMLTVLLGAALSVFYLDDRAGRRTRLLLVAGLTILAVVLLPRLSATFTEAGTEATSSATYRSGLLDLLPTMHPLGRADGFAIDPSGRPTYSGLQSIDNAVVDTALSVGWLPVLLLLAPLAAAVVTVLRRRGNPAMVAVIAQLPALFTVALITQYAVLFWVVVGVAASGHTRRRPVETHVERLTRAEPVGVA